MEELRALTGQEVAVSDWLVVDQARIDLFAEASDDHQWIHQDVERARRESPYGGTIAHGFLTLSLLSRLSRDAMDVGGDIKMRINYGLNKVRFPAAVPAGSRVRAHFTLHSVEDLEGGVQIVWTALLEVEGAPKPALVAEWLVRLYC